MAMLRHRAAAGSDADARLLLSASRWEDVLYGAELERQRDRHGVRLEVTLTRAQPEGWAGGSRRVDAAMLRDIGPAPCRQPRIFVCAPTSFVERAADLLVGLGHDPRAIHAERFGPTGR
jgi:ferredoxin-NADP reductase